MANDNHEYYNDVPINTFTDPITDSNPMTGSQVSACVLSAGIPYGFEGRAWMKSGSYAALDEANTNSPWNNGPTGVGVIHDTSDLIDIPSTNWEKYFHVIYRAFGGNVTQIDLKKYRNVLTVTAQSATVGGETKTYYDWTITTQFGENNSWSNSSMAPYRIIQDGSDMLGISMSGGFYNIWGHSEFGIIPTRSTYGHYSNFNSMCNSRVNVVPDTAPYTKWSGWDYELVSESDYKWYDDGHCAMYVYGTLAGGGFHAYGAQLTNNIDDIKMLCAICGLKFHYDGTDYKPIVEGGIVTGYTDDMTSESEWDTWEDIGDHSIPDDPTPVPPPPGPGYDDDPWSGATFAGTGVGGAGAFAKVYYMTSTELANLRSWMNSINVPEGFDPMQQIIGLSQVPVALSGSGPENVVFVNSSAVYDPGVTTRAVDTGVATQQAMGTPISYYLGSVDIVRRMQERGEPYLDYDCQIELYLPLIGMFSLDTQAVMGRTISAYAVLDPVSGTLAAYAYVTKGGQNLPIAYGSTTIGVDLPISAQQLSVSRAALKQANAQLGASLLSGALTMLAAASTGGKSSGSGAKTSTGSSGLSAAGIREAGSDYMKASQVGNVFGDFMNWGRTIRQLSYGNNTAVTGSFGGSTAQWSYPFTPYVKIIRPRYEKPSNYAHSQGVPCVQTKTIGSCTGFIQCIGADVSGITGATDLELQAIQAALSNGIYAGGGQ